MPPERTRELVDQLRTWYKNGTTRQMDLAAELGLMPQQLAEILAGRNRPTAEQILTIQDFLKDKNMSIRLAPGQKRRTSDDDEPLDHLTAEPNTLAEARDMVDALRAELKSKLAATTAPPLGPWDVVVPDDQEPPATTPPATAPTTVGLEKAKDTLTSASVEDLIAGIKTARAEGNLKAVGVIQAELESRVVTSSSNRRSKTMAFDSRDPKTWSGKVGENAFPAGCDNPRAINEYLSTLSMDALRGHLKGAPASATEQLQQKLAFAELQNRKTQPLKPLLFGRP
jgi:hypothetical protein